MRKELLFGLIGIVLTSLLVVIFAVNYNQKTALAIPSSSGINTGKGASQSSQNIETITLELVQKHNTPTDCWIIINNDVYEVTNYLDIHPGGAGRIIPYCGKDATTAFTTKGGEGTHSQQAKNDLANFKIGTLGNPLADLTNPRPPVTPIIIPFPPTKPPIIQSSLVLTLETVKQHNSAADCWIIISNSVYNVTNYLNIHPGGANQIIPYCGKDATIAFDTKGGKGSHSSSAQNDLAALMIGSLGSTVQSSIATQSGSATNVNPSKLPKRGKEDDD